MATIEVKFKTVSPLFEMERDGIKPFTCRKVIMSEDKFWRLCTFRSFNFGGNPKNIINITITNPDTNEQFTRKVTHVKTICNEPHWINIYWSIK